MYYTKQIDAKDWIKDPFLYNKIIERLKKEHMKDHIEVNLKESRLDKDLLSFFRVIYATDQESTSNALIYPISRHNEIAVLDTISKICKEQLQKYKTT